MKTMPQTKTSNSQHETLVSVKNVSRYYAENKAVDNISFDVKRGEVLGLLGPNGAGKSTTMQMITGNLAPSNGQIIINGFDILDEPKEAKNHLGYLPEQPPVYRELTVDEYLIYCAKVNRIAHSHQKDAMKLAKVRCGLEKVGARIIGNLSKGYQQRIGIAQAIIHSPAIIILDEPTVGLDPIQIKQIRALIRELGNDHSIILSTHILPEAQTVCERVIIINEGEVVAEDTPEQLTAQIRSAQAFVIRVQSSDTSVATKLRDLAGVSAVRRTAESGDGSCYQIEAPVEGKDIRPDIASFVVKNGWGLLEMRALEMSLEDVFLRLTTEEEGAA